MRLNEWTQKLGYHHKEQVRLLVYGGPGVGKTRILGTFPDPFIIDTDRGLDTLQTIGTLPPENRILELTKEDDCYEIIMDVLRKIRDGKAPFDVNPPESVIVDSVSKLGDFLLHGFMVNPSRAMSKSLKAQNPAYEKPEYAHWGVLLAQMNNIFDLTKDLLVHVGATAGIKEVEDSKGEKVTAHPYLQGQFKNIIGHCFNDFLFMDVTGADKNLRYVAYSAQYNLNPAKTRAGLPYKTENPTFQTLYPNKEVKTNPETTQKG